MNIRIYRSSEYVKAKTIEVGSNAPDWIDVQIDTTGLTTEAKTMVVDWYGKFPMQIDQLYFPTASGGNEQVKICADVESAEVTPELASGLLMQAIRESAKGRARYLAETAEARAKEAADRAALEARHDAAITAFLADPEYRPAGGFNDPGNGITLNIADGRIDHRHPRWGDLVAEYRARWAAQKEAKKAAAAESAKRRRTQLDEWVAANGTDGQRKRKARGLLLDDEIIASIRNQVFAPLDALPRYQNMTEEEVQDNYGCILENDFSGMSASYDVEDAESATDEQMAMIEEIETRLPGCEAVLRKNKGYLDNTSGSQDDQAALVRYSIRATIQVGALTLARSYAA